MKTLAQYMSEAVQNLAEYSEMTISDLSPEVMALLLEAYFTVSDKAP